MKIIKFHTYRDGGTQQFITEDATYFVDHRCHTPNPTKGMVFDGYPGDPGACFIENQEEIKAELMEALKDYKDEFYQTTIDYILENGF